MSIATQLGDVIAERYRAVTIVTFILSLVLMAGVPNLTFNADFRSYFTDDNPQLLAFEDLEADFNKRDTLSLLIDASEGGIYQPEVIELIQDLTNMAWQLPYSRRVDSLSNFQRIEADPEGLSIRDLAGDEVSLTAQSLEDIKAYVESEEALSGFLASADGTAAAIQVALVLPENAPDATRNLVAQAKEETAKILAEHNNIVTVHFFGSTVINLALEEAVAQDMSLLIPLSSLLIYALVWFLLRSFSALFIVITTISLSSGIVFGLFGWLGEELSPASGFIPSMIMVIAVADCIHLLVSFYHEQSIGKARIEAMKEALRINFQPMLITSLTTAIGLLCLNFSEAPPYRAMGNMGAAGALAAFLLSVTLVPALLCWLPAKKNVSMHGSTRLAQPMNQLANWLITHRNMALIVSSIAVIALAMGLPKNEMTERWHQYYDESFAIREALDFQNSHLNGVNFIEYRISTEAENGVNNPQFLTQLDQLQNWLAEQPNVAHIDSILPRLKKVHSILDQGNQEATALPTSAERAAQNMLVYELSLPMGLGVEEYINGNRDAVRVTVALHKTDSRSLMHFDHKVQSQASQYSSLIVSEGTGLDMVFAYISDRNMMSLLKGTALALVLISVILVFVLRSIKIGLVSLAPNLIPALVAYGFWGYTVGFVDLGLSVIACMSLGLVVDDTVHFLSKYQLARKELKYSAEQAIQYAFSTVGSAMFITTVVLALGFAILILSPFSPTWGMGGLLASTITFALIFDFLLLPALLLILDRQD